MNLINSIFSCIALAAIIMASAAMYHTAQHCMQPSVCMHFCPNARLLAWHVALEPRPAMVWLLLIYVRPVLHDTPQSSGAQRPV